MHTVEEIKQAISKLSPDDFARLRSWFGMFEAVHFDEEIERNAKSGKLDRLAAEALADHHAGRTREL